MLPQKARWWVLVGALALCVTGVATARQVRLELKSGRSIVGQLIEETSDTVTVAIAGIETTFPREQIGSVDTFDTLEEQYDRDREKIADDDYDARYDLARWLYDQHTLEGYQLALREVEAILGERTSHARAALLRDLLTLRIEQEEQREAERAMAAAQEDMEPADDADRDAVLSDEDVAYIKAFEIRLRERPTVVVPRWVVDDVFERYREHAVLEPFLGRGGKARFLRMPGYEQLGILFDLRAREYYDQVTFRTEPANLLEFRQRYHRNFIARYCGACHGEGPNNMQAPGLHLLTRGSNSEAVAYTNLMILRRTFVDGRPLIDQDDPARSPLIQYGLPRAEAALPHPDVPGWRPFFRTTRDRLLHDMVDWVKSLYGDGADYPMEFELPGELPPSQSEPEQIGAADGDA